MEDVGWAVSIAGALVAAVAAGRAARRDGLPLDVRRVWRHIALVMFLVAAMLVGGLVVWQLVHPAPVVTVAVHTAVVVLLVAPVYRLPSGVRPVGERLASTLDVGAVVIAAEVIVWHTVLRGFFDRAPPGPATFAVAAAVLTSAAAGVLLGARLLFTAFSSVYRSALLVLGATLLAGGLLPGLMVASGRADVDATLGLVPVVALVYAFGARPGGEQEPPAPEAVERWRARYRFAPVLAVGCVDALLLVCLARDSVRDRLVVGVTAVVLTAMAMARQISASRQLQLQEHRFRSLVQNSYDVVTINQVDGTITYMSGGSRRMFGREPGQRLGGNIFELLHPADRTRIEALFAEVIADPTVTPLWQSQFRHADGSWRQIEVLTTNLLHDPSVGGLVCNTRDITETHQLATRLTHEATHDALTGLANRALFARRTTEALAGQAAEAPAGRTVVVLVDLDDFKVVNDTLGHAAGDALLVSVADRLRSAVGDQGLVARLGGDEFALLLIPPAGTVGAATWDRQWAEAIVAGVAGRLAEPVLIEGRQHRVLASFGIVDGGPGDAAGDLLRRADIAMYEAKARGGGWCWFEPAMRPRGAAPRSVDHSGPWLVDGGRGAAGVRSSGRPATSGPASGCR